jgi:hypothetical protein
MTTFLETPGLPVTHEASAVALAKSHANADKIVFLTSIALPEADVFRNGLYQNIFALYELIETLGYKVYILTERPVTDVSGADTLHAGFRVTDMNSFVAKPFPIYHVIEVAMGLAPNIRLFFKAQGARVTKLYLGNVLNIDIEISSCIPNMTFSHHIAGEIDEIWTSPHYAPNVEYAAIINTSANGTCPPGKTVPYVWSPRFIATAPASANYVAPTTTVQRSFTIIEPNISFQKCALIPLMQLF